MKFFGRRENSSWSGRLVGTAFGLAIAALATTPVVWAQHAHGEGHGEAHATHVVACSHGDGDCDHGKMMKIVMSAGAEGLGMLHLGDDADAIDISGMEIGDTRFETVGDGTEVSITREEDGYVIDVDGEEIRIESLGGDEQVRIIVADGEHSAVSVGHGGSWTSDDGHVTRLINRSAGGHNGVTISGLGELDEDARERIIDALRSAGVDEDIRFGSGHGLHMINADGADGQSVFFSSGGSMSMDVDVKVEELLGDGDEDGKKVIIIKRIKVDKDDDK